MIFSRLMPLGSVFVATAAAGSSHDGGNKHFHGSKKVPILCKGLKTEDNGCTRYTEGFDVTGERLEPYHNLPDRPFPTAARSDERTTPRVPGSSYSSAFRLEWVKQKVANNSFAGENPVIHFEHPPYILELLKDVSEPMSISTSMEREEFGGEERLLDRVLGEEEAHSVELPQAKRHRIEVE